MSSVVSSKAESRIVAPAELNKSQISCACVNSSYYHTIWGQNSSKIGCLPGMVLRLIIAALSCASFVMMSKAPHIFKFDQNHPYRPNFHGLVIFSHLLHFTY